MAGSAQLWPGPRMRAFLRSVLTAEPGLDARTADMLSERLAKRIARMLVWDASGADISADQAVIGDKPESPDPTQLTDAPLPAPPDIGQPISAEPAPAAAEAFDPFAFSVVVVLKRQGRTALMKRLNAIEDASHLRKIAEAQHLGVDKAIVTAKKLREAIVTGAEQRLADRRAAAS